MALIRRNFDLKIASVVIAIALWFMFNYSSSNQTYSTTLEIPVTLHGAPAGLVAATGVASAKVELSGSRAVLERLSPTDFAAVIDCSNKTTGVQSLPISVTGPESDKIRSVTPATAIVSIDRFGYRTVPVVESGAEQGAIVADIQPQTVTVTGGETALARVVAARVSIEGTSATMPVVVMLKPVAVDADYAAVAGLNVIPPAVRVAIVPHKAPSPR